MGLKATGRVFGRFMGAVGLALAVYDFTTCMLDETKAYMDDGEMIEDEAPILE